MHNIARVIKVNLRRLGLYIGRTKFLESCSSTILLAVLLICYKVIATNFAQHNELKYWILKIDMHSRNCSKKCSWLLLWCLMCSKRTLLFKNIQLLVEKVERKNIEQNNFCDGELWART